MGEIAEMILEGTLCDGCGVYLGEGDGFPQNCGCNAPARPPTPKRRQQAWRKKPWAKEPMTTSINSKAGGGQSAPRAQEGTP